MIMKWWERITRLAKQAQIQKGMRSLFVLLFIFILLILGINIKDFDTEYVHEINHLDVKSVAAEWTHYETDGNQVAISLTLPDELVEGCTLAFETDHQTLTAMAGDKVLHERNPENPWYLGHEIGRVWNFIHIPHDMGGQVLSLVIDNYANKPILTNSSMIGSNKNILRHQLMDTAPLMIYVVISLLAGICLFLLPMPLVSEVLEKIPPELSTYRVY